LSFCQADLLKKSIFLICVHQEQVVSALGRHMQAPITQTQNRPLCTPATAFRSVFYAVYISRHILHRRISLYIRRNVLNGLAFTASFMVGGWMVSLVGTENYLKWILCGLLVFALSLVISLVTNMMFYRGDILAILSRTKAGKTIVRGIIPHFIDFR